MDCVCGASFSIVERIELFDDYTIRTQCIYCGRYHYWKYEGVKE